MWKETTIHGNESHVVQRPTGDSVMVNCVVIDSVHKFSLVLL